MRYYHDWSSRTLYYILHTLALVVPHCPGPRDVQEWNLGIFDGDSDEDMEFRTHLKVSIRPWSVTRLSMQWIKLYWSTVQFYEILEYHMRVQRSVVRVVRNVHTCPVTSKIWRGMNAYHETTYYSTSVLGTPTSVHIYIFCVFVPLHLKRVHADPHCREERVHVADRK